MVATALVLVASSFAADDSLLQRLPYNNPGLVVDLGVGLWGQPVPCDYDGDGDNDLVVATADVPYNGTYFFENATGGNEKFPVFKAGVRIADGKRDTVASYVNGKLIVATPESVYPYFLKSGFDKPVPVPYKPTFFIGRDNQWGFCDYDGDGVVDLVIGASDWREYGWDNAYNARGEWTNGPIHAYVYFMRNSGTNDAPAYAEAVQLTAGDKPLDVFGSPSPSFNDWDGDGDLDLICSEFLDKFTYFENVGTRTAPRYAEGRYVSHAGETIRMELEMVRIASFDWDKDGDMDLVAAQEDGRVALIECTGKVEQGTPDFLPPVFFQQEAADVKVGALATPCGVDWDQDGDDDLIVGDTAGFINFVENLDGGNPPKWAKPARLEAGGRAIRIQAGSNGSIQGPCEAKWGYTVPEVADWDQDGLKDILINSIWGEILWYRNTGTKGAPALAEAQPIEVEWEGATPKPAWLWWNPKGKQLVTQWRTSPRVLDLNRDGQNDLVVLDTEGYLAFFEGAKWGDTRKLRPGKRIFTNENGEPLRLNEKIAGKSGRRKWTFVDWDQDGRLDILLDGKNIDFLRNVGKGDAWAFKNEGPLDTRKLAGHDTCPAIVDWDHNAIPDLVIGAEDGFLYYLRNTASEKH
ncbi:MAG: FG-GAP-like repeat-containing protein [Candidatus Hydrogenedentes bacterium]|nr:FG-GAP-like repeat-containing protein [Candidatus Hydrogenedentota bacterium]